MDARRIRDVVGESVNRRGVPLVVAAVAVAVALAVVGQLSGPRPVVAARVGTVVPTSAPSTASTGGDAEEGTVAPTVADPPPATSAPAGTGTTPTSHRPAQSPDTSTTLGASPSTILSAPTVPRAQVTLVGFGATSGEWEASHVPMSQPGAYGPPWDDGTPQYEVRCCSTRVTDYVLHLEPDTTPARITERALAELPPDSTAGPARNLGTCRAQLLRSDQLDRAVGRAVVVLARSYHVGGPRPGVVVRFTLDDGSAPAC